MEALAGQVASQNRMAESVAKAVADRPLGGYGRNDAETVSALMGVDFKPYLPIINDSEPDWETHALAFDNALKQAMACSDSARQLKPVQVISMLRSTLMPKNGIRARVMTMAVDKGWSSGRLPDGASVFLVEVNVLLSQAIQETSNQKKDRIDWAFESCVQLKNQPHAEFSIKFEQCVYDALKAKMEGLYIDVDSLKRAYLRKLQPDLSSAVLSRDWSLDGPGSHQRQPVSFRK